MTTFTYNQSGFPAFRFSGGVPFGRIYNDVTAAQVNIPVGTDVLEFTGNASGFAAADGITGGTGGDTLIGMAENDVFHGGAGNDTIAGNDGNDRLDGGTGNNTLDGGTGFDVGQADFSDQAGDVVAVNGGVAAVTYGFTVGGLAAGSVTNIEMMTSLLGGNGNDRVGGVYRLDTTVDATLGAGKAGNDVAVVDLSASTQAFSGGIPVGRIYNDSTGRQLNLTGGFEALEFTGNASGSGAGVGITGGTGDDKLTGLDKNDSFFGGDGNDTIIGAAGSDRLNGGRGINTIDGGADFDLASFDFSDQAGAVVAVNGGVAGTTYQITSGGKAYGSFKNVEILSTLLGGSADDRLGGVYLLNGPDNYTLDAGTGGTKDVAVVDLSAEPGSNFSGGILGVPRIYNDTTGRQINLFAGFEVLEFTGNASGTGAGNGITGGSGDDKLTGLAKNDVFFGVDGNDTIAGAAGNDRLNGGRGINTIDGGADFDLASFDFSDRTVAMVAVNGGAPGVTYKITAGGLAYGSFKDVEILSFLLGGTADDRLGGVYLLTGGDNYTLDAGKGGANDVAVVDLSADSKSSFSGGLLATPRIYNDTTGRQIDLTGGFEVLEFTGNANGTGAGPGITGGTGNDKLTGLGLNDTFNGGDGNDILTGAGGDDRLNGGRGINTIDGGTGFDRASFDFSDQTGAVVAVNGGIPGVTYQITSGGKAYGSFKDVELLSTLLGGTGDDTLGGIYLLNGSENYTLDAGKTGNDVAIVDVSAETTNYFSGGLLATPRVYNDVTGRQINLTGGFEVLIFTGNAAGTGAGNGITGGTGNDILTGMAMNDTFHGGDGDDTLTGAGGNDRLDGGRGANTIDGGEGFDYAELDFSDQGAAMTLVNGGKAGTLYTVLRDGTAFGTIKNIEIVTTLLGGLGNDRLGGVYLLNGSDNHTLGAGGGGNDVAVVDLSADTGGTFSGLLAQRIYHDGTGRQITFTGVFEALEFVGNASGTAAGDGITGGVGDDILTGLGKNDIFHGGDGNDTISGAAGNDRLDGGRGVNTIDGGEGADTAQFDFSDQTGDVVAVNGGVADVTYQFTVGGKAYGSVENVEILSVLGGGTGNDRLGGVYTLNGSVNYTIDGGGGTDTAVIDLSQSLDAFSGGPDIGTRIYDDATGRQINLLGIEALDFTGNATGTATADGIFGGTGNDKLTGLAGNDRFRGGAGNDRLRGRLGDDDLNGGGDDDTAVFSGKFAASAFEFKNKNSVLVVTGADGKDTLTGIEFLEFDDGAVEVGAGFLGSTVSIATATVSKAEGSGGGTTPFTFTLTRTGGTKLAQTVGYVVAGATGAGTVPADAIDFPGGVFPTGTVTFAAGASTASLTINVAADSAVELNDRFSVTLVNPQAGMALGTASTQGVILNDDTSFAIAPLSALNNEGTGGTTPFTFTVTRAGQTPAGQTVAWTMFGGASDPANAADFAVGSPLAGILTFAAGQTSQVVTLSVAGDTAVEAHERFIVKLSAPSGGATITTAVADGQIGNDDTSLSLATPAVAKSEGTGGSTAFTFTVNRAGSLSGASSATWAVTGSGPTPADAADFQGGALPTGTVSFAVGEASKTITVLVAADSAVEADEGFTLTLSGATGATLGTATAAGTILSDDSTIAIAPLSASKPEGSGGGTTPYTFTVTRTGSNSVAQTVKWSVAGATGTGTQPSTAPDFASGVFPGGTVSFAAGETSKVLSVPVRADAFGELNERFAVTLSDPSAGVVLGTATAGGVVLNDDVSLAITPANQFKAEGQAGTTTVTFNITRPGTFVGTTTVDWSFTAGGVSGTTAVAASDVVGGVLPTGGQITFTGNQTVKTLSFAIAGDTVAELNESFSVTLSNPSGAAVITAAQAFAVVTDDDTIRGTTGNDTLVGTAGPDLFVIGQGLDSITGGLGLDTFRFTGTALGAATANAFTFEDFSRVTGEKFDLSQIDAIAGTALNDAFSFIGTAAFNGTPGQLRWEDQGTVRLIQGNVNADTVADLTIIVKAAGPVDASWFTA